MDKHLLCEKAMKMEKTLNAHNVHGSSAMGAYQPHQNWVLKGSNPSVQLALRDDSSIFAHAQHVILLGLTIAACEKGRRIRELTSFVQKRFEFCKNNVGLYAKRVTDIAESVVRNKKLK
ncbi:40S ribosomal protein S3-1-like protein [Tanacetum coccineum]